MKTIDQILDKVYNQSRGIGYKTWSETLAIRLRNKVWGQVEDQVLYKGEDQVLYRGWGPVIDQIREAK